MRVDRSSGIWGNAVVRMTVCDSYNTMAGLVSEETVIKISRKIVGTLQFPPNAGKRGKRLLVGFFQCLKRYVFISFNDFRHVD